MEEIVFKELLAETKFSDIEDFIISIVDKYASIDVDYEDVKESILKLVLYKFIKVNNSSSTEDCIIKESNFYEALKIGGVYSWLERKRSLSTVA